MSLYLVEALDVHKTEDRVGNPGLWSRGGLSGLEVHFDDKIIPLPRDTILKLVAHEYISQGVRHYEQMDADHAIAEMMKTKRDIVME